MKIASEELSAGPHVEDEWGRCVEEAVALACTRITEPQLETLEELAQLQLEESDPSAFAERDLRFVRETVRAAKSLAMELLLNSVVEVYEARPEIATAMHAHGDVVRASYTAVVQMIRAGDPDLARATVRQLLEALDQQTMEDLEREESRS